MPDANCLHTRLAGPVVLLLITICMFWKLTLTDQFTWMDQPDIADQVLPWLQFQATSWHAGRAPLWDPYNWGGQPLVGRMEPGAAYPLNWILFAWPLDDDGRLSWKVLDWYFVLIHLVGVLGCYWLCRDLKRSRAASVVAGVIFGLGGYVGTIGWPQKVNSAVWTPFVLLFFLRAIRGRRPLASSSLSGGFLGMALLGGHIQVPAILGLTMAGLWVYHLFRSAGTRWRVLAQCLVFTAGVLLVGALQILPAVEYGMHAVRWVGAPAPVGWGDTVPFTVHQEFSLHPVQLLGVVFSHWFHDTNQFIGLVALSMAAIGVSVYWRVKAVRMTTAVALGGLLFAMAGSVNLYGVLYSILPLLDKARTPVTGIHLFHFGVAVAAAYGTDACLGMRLRGLPVVGHAVRFLVALGVLLGLIVVAFLTVRPQAEREYDGLLIGAVVALLLAMLLRGWRNGKVSQRTAPVLLVLLLMVELGNSTGFDFKHWSQGGELLRNPKKFEDVAAMIRSSPGPVRVETDNSIFVFNFGELFGIDQLNGHSGLTSNVYRLGADYGRFRDLYGASLYVGRQPSREGEVEVYSRPDGVKIYRDPNVMPRVWTVHNLVRLEEKADIGESLRKTDFRREAFLCQTPPELEQCGGHDQAVLSLRGTATVTMSAEMRCKGMVVLADTYYPGWKATVDGNPVPIYELYGAIRGVVVGSGRHVIRMVYRPWTVILGAVLTGLGLIGLAAAAIRSSGRRGRRSAPR